MIYRTLSPRSGYALENPAAPANASPGCEADKLDATLSVHTSEVGQIALYASGIAHVKIDTDHWVQQEHIVSLLDWLHAATGGGAPLLIDRRAPYSLDFSAQQAITERLCAPAIAILVGDVQQVPLAEYSRETYLRKVMTRIFRSEAHALRWLSTFCDDPMHLPPHELIAVSRAELHAAGLSALDSDVPLPHGVSGGT